MGDKMAQLIFEKIKTSKIKETDSLEETRRGAKGYGTTGMNDGQLNEDQIIKSKTQLQNTGGDKQNGNQEMNEAIPAINPNNPNWEKRGRSSQPANYKTS